MLAPLCSSLGCGPALPPTSFRIDLTPLPEPVSCRWFSYWAAVGWWVRGGPRGLWAGWAHRAVGQRPRKTAVSGAAGADWVVGLWVSPRLWGPRSGVGSWSFGAAVHGRRTSDVCAAAGAALGLALTLRACPAGLRVPGTPERPSVRVGEAPMGDPPRVQACEASCGRLEREPTLRAQQPRASTARAGRLCGGRLRPVWCPRGDTRAHSEDVEMPQRGGAGQAWPGGLGQTGPSPTSLLPQGSLSQPVLLGAGSGAAWEAEGERPVPWKGPRF